MRADPRENYITLATRRFAEDGFHGVSLAVVAKDAGVSKQALLHFFGTKERLYREVLNSLCTRLCGEIEKAHDPNPTVHLSSYFSGMAQALQDETPDVRLVIRALLDSEPTALSWPLKPYLDRLTELVRSLPNASSMTQDVALAQAYRFIGSVQYIAISLPTIQGIYGNKTRDALIDTIVESVDAEIARICAE